MCSSDLRARIKKHRPKRAVQYVQEVIGVGWRGVYDGVSGLGSVSAPGEGAGSVGGAVVGVVSVAAVVAAGVVDAVGVGVVGVWSSGALGAGVFCSSGAVLVVSGVVELAAVASGLWVSDGAGVVVPVGSAAAAGVVGVVGVVVSAGAVAGAVVDSGVAVAGAVDAAVLLSVLLSVLVSVLASEVVFVAAAPDWVACGSLVLDAAGVSVPCAGSVGAVVAASVVLDSAVFAEGVLWVVSAAAACESDDAGDDDDDDERAEAAEAAGGVVLASVLALSDGEAVLVLSAVCDVLFASACLGGVRSTAGDLGALSVLARSGRIRNLSPKVS